MERVDKLIDILCDYIERRITCNDAETSDDVAKTTSALAKLVNARAEY